MVRKNLTNYQKLVICLKRERDTPISQRELAQWAQAEFDLAHPPSQATISNILKRKAYYEDLSGNDLLVSRVREPSHPDIDIPLAAWVFEAEASGTVLSGDAIKEKAREIASTMDFKGDTPPTFSNGWLYRFQRRHGIRQSPSEGIVPDSTEPRAIATSATIATTFSSPSSSSSSSSYVSNLSSLKDTLAQYAESDTYTLDFTPIHYANPPASPEHSDLRITLILATNADATDMRAPLIIGNGPLPDPLDPTHPLAKAKAASSLDHPSTIQYRHNPTASLTTEILRDWIVHLDLRMQVDRRKVLLLLDPSPAYHHLLLLHDLPLQALRLATLPSPDPAHPQPMHSEIIPAFRRRYTLDWLRTPETPDLASAIQRALCTWSNLPRKIIPAAFARAGLAPAEDPIPEGPIDAAIETIAQEIASLAPSLATIAPRDLLSPPLDHPIPLFCDADIDTDPAPRPTQPPSRKRTSASSKVPSPTQLINHIGTLLASLDANLPEDSSLSEGLHRYRKRLRLSVPKPSVAPSKGRTDASSGVESDVATEMSSEVPSEVPSDIALKVPSEVPSDIPSSSTSS